MAGFIDEFMNSMGPEVSQQLARNLGINKKAAMQIIPQVAPLILGGLQKQKINYGGEERVDHILNKYGSASVLDNIGDLFSKKLQDSTADPRLGGLLGDSGVQASNALQNKFNLDAGTAMKIIPMLAPVILGFLTKKRDADGLGSNGIAAMLDRDGDGSILDDIAGMFLQKTSGAGAKGNILGGLLGGLLGKKR
ncbi:DUF937 domain-containing protein [candidate division KSB1 bacterium]|nr:DUF937 domain-containing protein [candidate division KSB1 bacterium]RQW01420.1 MAG: DUF937 domain-containing protein [candidate division KSB1 bacterium]